MGKPLGRLSRTLFATQICYNRCLYPSPKEMLHMIQHLSSVVPVTVVHDVLLLTAPSLNEPGLMWIPAGTELHIHATHHGFFAVDYRERHGFLPVAICSPCADVQPAYLRFDQPRRLQARYTYTASDQPLLLIESGTSLRRLGHDGTWSLVQCQDGRMGFINSEDSWISIPVGCLTVLGWCLLGVGWALTNWLGMSVLMAGSLGRISSWTIVSSAVILVAGCIVLLVRSYSDVTYMFSLGALTIGIIGGALSLTLL